MIIRWQRFLRAYRGAAGHSVGTCVDIPEMRSRPASGRHNIWFLRARRHATGLANSGKEETVAWNNRMDMGWQGQSSQDNRGEYAGRYLGVRIEFNHVQSTVAAQVANLRRGAGRRNGSVQGSLPTRRVA